MTDYSQTLMYREAAEIAGTVAKLLSTNEKQMKTLGAHLRRAKPQVVITCARGSSDAAATYAQYLIETRIGTIACSQGPAIASIYKAPLNLSGNLCLVISQSGRSADILASAQAAKTAGAYVVALVNAPGSPLGDIADEVVALHAGTESSVAATKSCLAAMAAIAHLVAHWSGDEGLHKAVFDLPAQLKSAWAENWSAAVPILSLASSLFVLGRGVGFGIAQEMALKLKETSGLHAEAFSAAEVQHGPMAIVRPGFPVLVCAQNDATLVSTRDSIAKLTALGANLMLAGTDCEGAINLPTVLSHPALEPLLQLQSFYRMANQLAVARGRNPDAPPHLNKVTSTV